MGWGCLGGRASMCVISFEKSMIHRITQKVDGVLKNNSRDSPQSPLLRGKKFDDGDG